MTKLLPCCFYHVRRRGKLYIRTHTWQSVCLAGRSTTIVCSWRQCTCPAYITRIIQAILSWCSYHRSNEVWVDKCLISLDCERWRRNLVCTCLTIHGVEHRGVTYLPYLSPTHLPCLALTSNWNSWVCILLSCFSPLVKCLPAGRLGSSLFPAFVGIHSLQRFFNPISRKITFVRQFWPAIPIPTKYCLHLLKIIYLATLSILITPGEIYAGSRKVKSVKPWNRHLRIPIAGMGG